MKLRAVIGAVTAMCLMAGGVTGQEERPIKIGVLTDLSSLYAEHGGPGSVEAARMAIDDFGGVVLGKPIALISADHRNSLDLGTRIARQWYSEGVDAIVDVPNSGIALAVQQLSRELKKIVLFSSPASADLTGPKCSPYTVHWTYDTYAMAHGTAKAIATATAGSSSPRTMPSATRWSVTPAT